MAQIATIRSQGPIDSVAGADLVAAVEYPRRGAILVVEDRDDVRQGLVQLLELHNFLVTDAPDGENALKQLREDREGFALVLLDLVLPGSMDGREVRACQLADPQLAAVPTIVITASELDPAERACLSPAAWLEKPFRFDDLLAIIRRYVTPEMGGLISE